MTAKPCRPPLPQGSRMAEPGIDPPSLPLAAHMARATASAVVLGAGLAPGTSPILDPRGSFSLVTRSALAIHSPPRSLADPTSA